MFKRRGASPATFLWWRRRPDMRKRDLERLLIEWQVALALADWEIELRASKDPDDMDAEGTVDCELNERTATIHVNPKCPDPERTIVHELIHLWTMPIRSERTDLCEEQAVEAISRALVNLRRQAQG